MAPGRAPGWPPTQWERAWKWICGLLPAGKRPKFLVDERYCSIRKGKYCLLACLLALGASAARAPGLDFAGG